MRRVDERKAWHSHKAKFRTDPSNLFEFEACEIDLSSSCLVIGGRNGTGKTRLLRAIAEELDDRRLFLDLHLLCEQVLDVLRSREDFGEMTTEFEVLGPSEARREDLQRVIGREYEKIEWYAFEVEPDDDAVAARFRWDSDESLVPYFVAEHRGVSYSAREMGLGEFSIHLLFWILDQYRDARCLTLLLDEPDAYLPPVGASTLLHRLLTLCLSRDWRLIVTTHSSEMITEALDERAFTLLQLDQTGKATATHCQDDPTVGDLLLPPPPTQRVIFVEDESASVLAHALIERIDRRWARSTMIVWGNGYGYISSLRSYLPHRTRAAVSFAYLFDGDQRASIGKSRDDQWPTLFLPTNDDPDMLFYSVRGARMTWLVGSMSRASG